MNSTLNPALERDALYAKSQVYIRRGLRAQADNDTEEYQLWASLALELLGKAALAKVHPALVADPTHHQSSLPTGMTKLRRTSGYPLVTLPERLNSEICKFFKVDKSVWAAPDASAQTLADQASRFQAAFRSDQGPRRVGVPLLVHRRCQEPMFSVSNKIAYDGQMVHAPGPRDAGAIGAVLGPSKWF